MAYWKIFIWTTVAVIIGFIRPYIPPTPLNPIVAYQAIAHMFMGIIITLAIVKKEWIYGRLAILLTAVEIIVFAIGHHN